jgi:hypothetical protein
VVDPTKEMFLMLERLNHSAVNTIIFYGYHGDMFKDWVARKPQSTRAAVTTKANTLERQQLLIEATTHGDLFRKTAGSHLNTDDLFIAMEMKNRNEKVVVQEKFKDDKLKFMKTQTEALKFLATQKEEIRWKRDEVVLLIKWKNGGKPVKGSKEEVFKQWRDTWRGAAAPTLVEWTNEEEILLNKWKVEKVSLDMTEYGRQRKVETQKMMATVTNMSVEEKRLLKDKLEEEIVITHIA